MTSCYKRLLAIILLPAAATAGDSQLPCWLDGSSTYQTVTTIVSELKSELLATNLEDPIGDVKARIAHGDYRLIAVGIAMGLHYPGIDAYRDDVLICEFGTRIYIGTTDLGANISEEHWRLIEKIRKYAEVFNVYLRDYYSENDINDIRK